MSDISLMHDHNIDDEIAAFVECTNQFYPPDAIDLSMAEQRRVYDRMCQQLACEYPDGVTSRDDRIVSPTGSLPIRWYQAVTDKNAATILYFHGGGFVVGGLDSHDDVCAELCLRSGHQIISVDYRLAPEFLFPAAHDDALTAFRICAKEGRPVVVAGDSAGGNLAASISIATRSEDIQPIGQLLIYPGLGGRQYNLPSYKTKANAPLLTTRDVEFYEQITCADVQSLKDPLFSPLALTDYEGMPPCVAFSASVDPLCDDSRVWVERLTAAGGSAKWICESGLPHGYLRARHISQKASDSFTRICKAAERLGDGV